MDTRPRGKCERQRGCLRSLWPRNPPFPTEPVGDALSAIFVAAGVDSGIHKLVEEIGSSRVQFHTVEAGCNGVGGGTYKIFSDAVDFLYRQLPSAVRYGMMRENVLSLTIVLPDGRVIRTARRARKSSAGYDLPRLFVGSEGTLGVITEVTVRLYGIRAAMSAATCSFPSVEAAVNTVIRTIQSGVPVARIELADAAIMEAVDRYSKIDLPVAPTLWMDFHHHLLFACSRLGRSAIC